MRLDITSSSRTGRKDDPRSFNFIKHLCFFENLKRQFTVFANLKAKANVIANLQGEFTVLANLQGEFTVLANLRENSLFCQL